MLEHDSLASAETSEVWQWPAEVFVELEDGGESVADVLECLVNCRPGGNKLR